jgi:4-hydroxythreonine-4-phosphate dehydrogenase
MMTLGQTPATPLAPLALTLGDAAGIGPEIVIKLHLAGLPAPCVVYGDAGALRRAVAALEAPLRVIELTDVSTLATYAHEVGCLFVRPTHPALPENLPLGRVDARAGQSAYDALCLAIDDAMLGKVSAIVTAPLNKEAMHAAGLDFPGHTEILAQRSGTPYVAMMLVNDRLRVILATIHIALSEVSPTLTTALELRTIELAQQACQAMGIASPRIGVAGLNPHAGEHGKFGREDLDIIAPAIAQAQARGIKASGPWPGDTLFMRARLGEFDICVAQYHDQGLIPIKYLGIDQGVNITVGLPFVRTSVDHGTAFDIAGKGIADPSSLREAFEMARTMLSQKK